MTTDLLKLSDEEFSKLKDKYKLQYDKDVIATTRAKWGTDRWWEIDLCVIAYYQLHEPDHFIVNLKDFQTGIDSLLGRHVQEWEYLFILGLSSFLKKADEAFKLKYGSYCAMIAKQTFCSRNKKGVDRPQMV